MKKYAYDIEVYPNMFMVGFIDLDDASNNMIGFRFDLFMNDLSQLKNFLKRDVLLFGYNSYDYDDIVLKYVTTKKNVTNKMIYNFSKSLIYRDVEKDEKLNKEIYRLRNYPCSYKTSDLFRIGNFNIGYSRSSLKEIGIRLNHEDVIDLPYPPEHILTPSQMDDVYVYNKNDILITKKLFFAIKNKYEMRISLGKDYNEDFLNSSDSNIANKIVNRMYSQKTDKILKEFKNLRTIRESLDVKDILPELHYDNKNLCEFYENLKNTTLRFDIASIVNRGEITQNINITYDLILNFGVGGLHSIDKPFLCESDNDYRIIDLDVTSYYPNIILNGNIYPDHLSTDFLDVLRELTYQRTEAKKNGNKSKSDGLKIAINSIYGKLSFAEGWLFDMKCSTSVTFSGQLYLMKLIDMLICHFPVISVNTDGVTCKVKRSDYEKFKSIYNKWENLTGFNLEETEYVKYIRRDVNNYIAVKEDGDVKMKGVFVIEDLGKSINARIIKKSLFNYFVKNIPVEDVIMDKKNSLHDYVLYYKTNKQFDVYYGVKKLQKTNRWYASKRGDLIYKKRNDGSNKTGSVIKLYGGDCCILCNHIDSDILPIDIDYSFYIRESNAIIRNIKNVVEQFNLF